MKISSFWKNRERKVVDPKLFSETAEKLAKELKQDHDKNKKLNKRSQIRKFYDEIVKLNQLKTQQKDQQNWEYILPLLHMLIPKAVYAQGRGLVSENFVDFIRSSVTQIKTPDDLSVFADFFEAFMGFYRYYMPSN